MQEILNELFYGNIHPNEKQFIRDSEYGKAIKTVSDCEEKLMTLLSGKEPELFEKLMKAQGDSSHVNGREKFVEGFRLGARIALEIMAAVPKWADPVALCALWYWRSRSYDVIHNAAQRQGIEAFGAMVGIVPQGSASNCSGTASLPCKSAGSSPRKHIRVLLHHSDEIGKI